MRNQACNASVVFVIAVASLINLSLQAKQKYKNQHAMLSKGVIRRRTRTPAVRSFTAVDPPPPLRPAASTLLRLHARPPPTCRTAARQMRRYSTRGRPIACARDSFEGSPQVPGRVAPTPSTPSA
eukprot:scaffold8902_cov63-Phaeocystis_antarctica.AAC.2